MHFALIKSRVNKCVCVCVCVWGRGGHDQEKLCFEAKHFLVALNRF